MVCAQLIVNGWLPFARAVIEPVALTTPLIGRPVALVRVPEDGVPRAGLVRTAFVMAVLEDRVVGKSPAAIARKAGAPAEQTEHEWWSCRH